MGAPLEGDGVMTDQLNMITVRNGRGADILNTAVSRGALELSEIPSNQKAQMGGGISSRTSEDVLGSDDGNKNGVGTGGGPSRDKLVMTTTEADSLVVRLTGGEVREQGMPRWLGEVFATIIGNTSPRGLEFARYSIDYHYLRNWLYTHSDESAATGERTVPQYAKAIMARYDASFRDGLLEKLRAAEGKVAASATPLRQYVAAARERHGDMNGPSG